MMRRNFGIGILKKNEGKKENYMKISKQTKMAHETEQETTS